MQGRKRRIPTEHVQLPVRTTRTIAGSGEVRLHRSVFCPRRDESVPLRECVACQRYEGLKASPTGTVLECAGGRVAAGGGDGGSGELVPAELLTDAGSPPSAADRTEVSAIMNRVTYCVRSDVSIESVTTLLVEHEFNAVAVADDEDFPIGVVSKSDLLRLHHEAGETTDAVRSNDEALRVGFHSFEPASHTVAEIMMPIAFTLAEQAPLSHAAAIMALEGVQQLPVVDALGKIVGMVSALDIARWLAKHEGYIVSSKDEA